ncbi:RluA family pseudouridine synthase [Ampullimonas aquatilis]|uniref:RluA family pseudouridine synthase n=1 Tax=Ampullimonas aquatilis TaxID=1341549 RepID=UPI003C769F9F
MTKAKDYSSAQPMPAKMASINPLNEAINEEGQAEEDSLYEDEMLDEAAAFAAQEQAPITVSIPYDMAKTRIDKTLAELIPQYSRARLQSWLENGRITLDGVVAKPKQTLYGGEVAVLTPELSAEVLAYTPEPVEFPIVYEDDDILVVNKPAGLVVHPAAGNWSGTLLNGLLHRIPQLAHVPRAGIVHRLDKDTSGLMVVAKNLVAQTELVRQLQARTVTRRYLALVWGMAPEDGSVGFSIGRSQKDRLRMAAYRTTQAMEWRHLPKAINPNTIKEARTHFKLIDMIEFETKIQPNAVSWIECALETGRTHQIRVHMQAVGLPLVADPLYGGVLPISRIPFNASAAHELLLEKAGDAMISRQALHATFLQLIHPGTGKSMEFEADLPDDLMALSAALGFDTDMIFADPEWHPDE